MDQPQTGSKFPIVGMAVGSFLTLVSTPCIAAAIHDVVTGAENMNGALIMGVFFAVLLAIGAGLFGWGFKHRKKMFEPATAVSSSREQHALQIISRLGGEITVAQLAMHTDLSVKQANTFLEDLQRQGVAQTWVTDEGALSYRIPHLGEGHTQAEKEFVFETVAHEEFENVDA